MSKLSYIVNQDQSNKVVAVASKTNGVYHFIQKKGEKFYNAYRAIITEGGTYYVQTHLPRHVYEELITSGRVHKLMS